jgi:hypothetical protein
MMLFKELWGREHSVVVSFDSIIREHLVPKGSAKALYNIEKYMRLNTYTLVLWQTIIILLIHLFVKYQIYKIGIKDTLATAFKISLQKCDVNQIFLKLLFHKFSFISKLYSFYVFF